jgi:hypothetical protein
MALTIFGWGRLAGQPREILIIRHAEKPDNPDDPDLTPRGYSRAAALVQFFSSQFDTPAFLFATQVSKASNRPVETLTPVAAALHMGLNSTFADDQYPALAQEILSNPKYAGQMLIICWHHGNIPALAKALGVDVPLKNWSDSVFDRVWRIQYTDGPVSFSNMPQRLLYGDSQE